MSNSKLTEKDIRLKLLMCSGSEDHYKHPLFKGTNFTEGILLMVEYCQANWLLVDLLANISKLKSKNDFIVVNLLKNQGETKCTLVFEDGNENEICPPIPYNYTTFPLSDWKDPEEDNQKLRPAISFWYGDGVLYLPNEH